MFLMQRKHDTYFYLCFADLIRFHNQRTSANEGHICEVRPVRLCYTDYFLFCFVISDETLFNIIEVERSERYLSLNDWLLLIVK
jgi:hypothetical protein